MNSAKIIAALVSIALAGNAIAQQQGRGYQFFGSPPPYSANIEGPSTPTESGGGGLDLGIFARKPFTITASVRQGFDSNVFTTSDNPEQSWYANFAAGINYSFGTPRLQLNANLGAGYTYYYNRAGDPDDWNVYLGMGLTYLATERLTLTFSTSTAYTAQPDLSVEGGGADRNNGEYFYTNTNFGANYQWTEKFSTTTTYNFGATIYVEDPFSTELSYITQTIGQSFNWLILPKTTGRLEYRVNPVTYTGSDLDSFGQFFLVGWTQLFNPRLTWTGNVGLELRLNNNPVDGRSTYLGPYFDSYLRYQFGPASSLGWSMRYGTEASGIFDVTQRQTFRTGFDVVHGFTPRLSANFGAYWLVNYYDQANVIDSFYENIFSFNVGLNFAVNRFVSLSAGYQYTIDAAPEWTGRNYNRSVAFVGANFTF